MRGKPSRSTTSGQLHKAANKWERPAIKECEERVPLSYRKSKPAGVFRSLHSCAVTPKKYRRMGQKREAIFKAIYCMYTTDLNDLDLPSYILTSQCASQPNVTLTQNGGVNDFSVAVTSKLPQIGRGHIRALVFGCSHVASEIVPSRPQGDTGGKVADTECINTALDRSYVEQSKMKTCSMSGVDCWHGGQPRRYLAYHLDGHTITLDGHLDDQAWQEVPWSESFVDIRGEHHAPPRFDTRFKLRWDNDRLYVGARLEENQVWATFTENEQPIYQDNAFEVFVDADRSTHNYKEMEVNALGTTWDLMLSKAYIDDGVRKDWDGDLQVAVYTDGEVNNPAINATFWSVEMSISLRSLINGTGATHPKENDVWSMIFARSEWMPLVQNGSIIKDPTSDADWWSWGATGAVNLHIPSRWGLVQLKVNKLDTKFSDDLWHVYRVLFDMFDAQKVYKALNGMYTTDLTDLHIPPYILTSYCVYHPNVTLTQNGGVDDFTVSVTSKQPHVGRGNIRGDRYIWFD